MIELESERLQIREITADDLEAILPVHLSNSDFLEFMEGSEGNAGRYDLDRWQRDWYIAQLMPGRHMLGCYLKSENVAVGFSEYMEEVEEDNGQPWIGVLSISKAYQRQGLGSEALYCLLEHFRRNYGWSHIHGGVLAQIKPALAFAEHVGFQPIHSSLKQLAGGLQQYIVMERSLNP